MNLIDAWIFALPAEWDALATEEQPFSYVHSNAITGYWVDPAPYKVYNVWGTQEDIQAILDALTDVQHVFAWGQDAKRYDSLDVWPTDPSVILSVMKPHITYDEDGNVIGSTPATKENPNWGHCFQTENLNQRIFAGTFSAAFSGAFL